MTKVGLARAIMEIDAKDWLTELERQVNENAMNLAILKQQVNANHNAVMTNSDVRLAAIMERFDRLDKLEEQKEAKTLAAKRLWIPIALSVVLSLGGLIKLAYIDPLNDRLDAFDRRLKYVQEVHASTPSLSDPK